MSCFRLNRAYLARKHPLGLDLGKDDRGAEVIPIAMETSQSGRQLNSSLGDKEDFGIYAELRESDTFRTSLSYTGTSRSHSWCIQPRSLFICMEGTT
jgi:hypothetical protein